jgi:hypothetical protein
MILDHVHEHHSRHYQLKALRIGAYKFIHFLAILEEYECRHLINLSVKSGQSNQMNSYRSDADLCGNILMIIDIHLVELQAGELVSIGELLEDGGDGPARSTPRCPKVDHGILVRINLKQG